MAITLGDPSDDALGAFLIDLGALEQPAAEDAQAQAQAQAQAEVLGPKGSFKAATQVALQRLLRLPSDYSVRDKSTIRTMLEGGVFASQTPRTVKRLLNSYRLSKCALLCAALGDGEAVAGSQRSTQMHVGGILPSASPPPCLPTPLCIP